MQTLSFLEEVAQGLTQKFGSELSKCHLVLPSRRSCMYLKLYLSEQAKEAVFAPLIVSMEDFIHDLTAVEVEEITSLIFDLFESYKKFDADKTTSLERFAPLGSIILRDFNLIDRELLEAKQLFQFMEDVQTLERWGKTYGQDVKIRKGSSIPAYHQFWKQVERTYFDFNQRLKGQNKAYSGMAYRRACEEIDELMDNLFHVAFIGFSQFSRSEEFIIRKLIKNQKASTYWDADHYYLDNKFHEAGDYLRTYRDRFWEKELQYTNKNIAEEQKEIEFIAVDHAITQAKLVGSLLDEEISRLDEKGELQDFKSKRNHTAVLLPDESLLMPILYSLPDDRKGLDLSETVNVTMGISLRNTPLFTLIQNVFLMQENRSTQGGKVSIYHKDVARMLQHPYLYLKERDEEAPLFKVEKDNQIYVPVQELTQYPVNGKYYKVFFQTWQRDKIYTVFQYFYRLIEFLADQFSGSKFTLDNEYLFQFYTLLKRLQNILEASQETISVPTFKQFLFEAIRETTIPFTGEPINPIQVMGMLESRALDFENIIILSCNEGTLPQGKSYNSIIPFDVKKQFGLPTHLASESSFAYTFYRLLHRAKRITLVYTTDSDATGGGEKSRYLAQIEHEMAGMDNITLKKRQVNLPLPQRKRSSIQVIKSEDIQFRLRTYLTKEGLTPTYISRYLNAPLQFFEQKILGLYEDEELQALTFGNLIHGSIERLFESLVGKTVTPQNVQALRQTTDFNALLTEVLAEQAGGILQDRGKTFLLKQTAADLLLDFLAQQEEDAGFQLLAQEHKMEAQISVSVSESETILVKLCGTADRIIQTPEGSLHLIDFKTGKFNKSLLKIDSIQELLLAPEKRNVVQLVLYRYLLLCAVERKDLPNLPSDFALSPTNVISDFLYFKALDEKLKTYTLKEEPKSISDFKKQIEQFIAVLVRDMLDASKPFSESLELGVEDW